MKGQLKSAVTLSFIAIICLIVALLLAAMKKMYIESWFVSNRNVIIGFVTGLLLTSIVSFSNLFHARRLRTQQRCNLLEAFLAESASFQAQLDDSISRSDSRAVPSSGQYELGQALARLLESANAILRSERISPLKSSTIQKGGMFVSSVSAAEEAFERAFVDFTQSCNETYQLHSSLPYLSDENERETAFQRFSHLIQALSASLAPGNALQNVLAQYRAAIKKSLGDARKKS